MQQSLGDTARHGLSKDLSVCLTASKLWCMLVRWKVVADTAVDLAAVVCVHLQGCVH
jgi:hypothetical protein